jgi:hypothetical protein
MGKTGVGSTQISFEGNFPGGRVFDRGLSGLPMFLIVPSVGPLPSRCPSFYGDSQGWATLSLSLVLTCLTPSYRCSRQCLAARSKAIRAVIIEVVTLVTEIVAELEIWHSLNLSFCDFFFAPTEIHRLFLTDFPVTRILCDFLASQQTTSCSNLSSLNSI